VNAVVIGFKNSNSKIKEPMPYSLSKEYRQQMISGLVKLSMLIVVNILFPYNNSTFNSLKPMPYP